MGSSEAVWPQNSKKAIARCGAPLGTNVAAIDLVEGNDIRVRDALVSSVGRNGWVCFHRYPWILLRLAGIDVNGDEMSHKLPEEFRVGVGTKELLLHYVVHLALKAIGVVVIASVRIRVIDGVVVVVLGDVEVPRTPNEHGLDARTVCIHVQNMERAHLERHNQRSVVLEINSILQTSGYIVGVKARVVRSFDTHLTKSKPLDLVYRSRSQ